MQENKNPCFSGVWLEGSHVGHEWLGGEVFGLSAARALKVLGEVERAVGLWRRFGKELGMTHAELDAFAPAFEPI